MDWIGWGQCPAVSWRKIRELRFSSAKGSCPPAKATCGVPSQIIRSGKPIFSAAKQSLATASISG
ncbi:MAG: hypothetical protein Kow0060_23640 [Methylohalobius crimeensis]